MLGKNLIGGAWVEGSPFETRNPSDLDEVVGSYFEADAVAVNIAVESARTARRRWASTSPWQRAEVLDRAGAEILSRADEIGRLLAREEGKTLFEARAEALRAGQILKFFAGEAVRLQGEKGDSIRTGVEAEITRQPVGVIALITPWNFPIAIPAWKAAPALAFGNTVVLKPSEIAPGCAVILADALARAGLPEGAFNLVLGRGAVTGAALADHAGIDGLSFTGSQATGARILRSAADRMLRVQLEMGGKNPLVVLDDADLDTAVECAVQGAYYSTGQRCTASSRIIVTRGIHDRFVEATAARIAALRVGHALDPSTQIGPVVSEAQLAKNLGWIARAVEDGARLAMGGERIERQTRGYYQAPALFVGTTNEMAINREEVFGPVACVIEAEDFAEALAIANDTRFGLSAGICTTSLKHAAAFKQKAEAGMVMVNLATAGVDFHVPFGGTKGSSYGPREQGGLARDFYTVVKTAYTAP